jgi:uncharacterized protein YciI
MYIISLTYKVAIEEVDSYLECHINYLNEQYQLGNFIASGRKVPRTGGVILSKLTNKEKLIEIVEKDPFFLNNLADYELIEFVISKASDVFKNLLDE